MASRPSAQTPAVQGHSSRRLSIRQLASRTSLSTTAPPGRQSQSTPPRPQPPPAAAPAAIDAAATAPAIDAAATGGASPEHLHQRIAALHDAVGTMRALHDVLVKRLGEVRAASAGGPESRSGAGSSVHDAIGDSMRARALLVRHMADGGSDDDDSAEEEEDEDADPLADAAPPMSAEGMQRLPRILAEPLAVSRGAGVSCKKVCAVCHEGPDAAGLLHKDDGTECAPSWVWVRLPCAHEFCEGCAYQWLSLTRTCPTCRALVASPRATPVNEPRVTAAAAPVDSAASALRKILRGPSGEVEELPSVVGTAANVDPRPRGVMHPSMALSRSGGRGLTAAVVPGTRLAPAAGSDGRGSENAFDRIRSRSAGGARPASASQSQLAHRLGTFRPPSAAGSGTHPVRQQTQLNSRLGSAAVLQGGALHVRPASAASRQLYGTPATPPTAQQQQHELARSLPLGGAAVRPRSGLRGGTPDHHRLRPGGGSVGRASRVMARTATTATPSTSGQSPMPLSAAAAAVTSARPMSAAMAGYRRPPSAGPVGSAARRSAHPLLRAQ